MWVHTGRTTEREREREGEQEREQERDRWGGQVRFGVGFVA